MTLKLVIHSSGRRYLHKDGDLHTQYGVIKENKIKIGKKIKSHIGQEFIVIKPTVTDFIKKMKKGAQVIYPKDLGLIAGFSGVSSGWKVVDCGAGSGALSIFLGNIVGPKGKIISYEKREEFAKVAKENIKLFGLEKVVKVKEKDFLKGANEKNADLVCLDMEESEKAVKIAYDMLKLGGFLVIFSARVEDVGKNREVLKNSNFIDVFTIESGIRKLGYTKCVKIKGFHGYVAYLTFARKS